MTETEYRAHPGVNQSTLWEMRKSPAHYRYALEHPETDTPALRMGKALHAAVLQPESFKKDYTVLPDHINRRTKAGQEEYLSMLAAGKTILTVEEWARIEAMAQAIRTDAAAAELLTDCRTEVPIFWDDQQTGIQCKARLDAYKPGIIVDVKSCESAATNDFLRKALHYGYDLQAAHYTRGAEAVFQQGEPEFFFVAVEKAPPYAVNVLHASVTFIDRGAWRLIGFLEKLKHCRETGTWPGYGEHDLILPEWATVPDDE